MSVLVETSIGTLVIDLYTEKCPLSSFNFLKLCKIKYFNYNLFHSLQPGFMVQTGTGDPIGSGKNSTSIYGLLEGPSKRFFRNETHSDIKHNRRGLVSMAVLGGGGKDNEGRALVNGSQFFITLGDNLDYLDGKHTIFGEIAEGWDTLDKIEALFTDEKGRPLRDVRINHTIILDDPFDDPEGLIVPDRSPDPPREVLESTRLGIDESVEDDITEEEKAKIQRDKDAKARSTTLEILGDLPYADIKPPENILFVCKLNPITRSEDLMLIFCRFGKILSCEVIKDQETDKSLCYAFIEFDEKSACEEAYFKMQNVIIDDRRIHVDFSQSVSKLHNIWIKNKMGTEMGGEGLYKKRRYRMQEELEAKSYDMVFEGDDKNDLKGRSRSRSPGRQPSKDSHSARDNYRRKDKR